MIKHETAARIAFAYSEITAAETLLKELRDANARREQPDFRDAFGRRQGLQLGVPSGNSSHRIMDVSPRLAEIIIQAHIDDKRAEIAALSEVAHGELSGATAAKVES